MRQLVIVFDRESVSTGVATKIAYRVPPAIFLIRIRGNCHSVLQDPDEEVAGGSVAKIKFAILVIDPNREWYGSTVPKIVIRFINVILLHQAFRTNTNSIL